MQSKQDNMMMVIPSVRMLFEDELIQKKQK
jgi:hypothetical protein